MWIHSVLGPAHTRTPMQIGPAIPILFGDPLWEQQKILSIKNQFVTNRIIAPKQRATQKCACAAHLVVRISLNAFRQFLCSVIHNFCYCFSSFIRQNIRVSRNSCASYFPLTFGSLLDVQVFLTTDTWSLTLLTIFYLWNLIGVDYNYIFKISKAYQEARSLWHLPFAHKNYVTLKRISPQWANHNWSRPLIIANWY